MNEMISGLYHNISYHSVITTNATDISRSGKHSAHLLRLCHFAFLLTKCYNTVEIAVTFISLTKNFYFTTDYDDFYSFKLSILMTIGIAEFHFFTISAAYTYSTYIHSAY